MRRNFFVPTIRADTLEEVNEQWAINQAKSTPYPDNLETKDIYIQLNLTKYKARQIPLKRYDEILRNSNKGISNAD